MNARFAGPSTGPCLNAHQRRGRRYRTQKSVTVASSGAKRSKSAEAATFVTLDIKVVALERLIGEQKLVAEELHCRDVKTKDVVQQAMLNALLVVDK
jgi:hypothetical protein